MTAGVRVLSLCDGIAAARLALHQLGVRVTRYDAIEINPKSRLIADSNWADITRPTHNVREWTVNELFDHRNNRRYDLLVSGFPCQPHSVGNNGRDGIAAAELLAVGDTVLNLAAAHVFADGHALLENVAMRTAIDAVAAKAPSLVCKKINSRLFVPQNRARAYFSSWALPAAPGEAGGAKKPVWRRRYRQRNQRLGNKKSPSWNNGWWYQGGGIAPCITKTGDISRKPVERKVKGVWEKIGLPEIMALQGFPKNYTGKVSISKTAQNQALGESFTVPVIKFALAACPLLQR